MATELSTRAWDNKYNFQLSEILIFEGNENTALEGTVTSSSESIGYDSARSSRFLIDGFMPYTMDAATGIQSAAFLEAPFSSSFIPTLVIDLEETKELTRIQLHSLEISNKIPRAKAFDYGIPKRLLIEGATDADFSDSTVLLDLYLKNDYDTGPIIIRNLKKIASRFVKLTILEPVVDNLSPEPTRLFGLSEIEFFANSKNVAYQKVPTANFEVSRIGRSLNSLTDGHNFYGKILPIREWLEQLAERHLLKTEQPIIRNILNRRYHYS